MLLDSRRYRRREMRHAVAPGRRQGALSVAGIGVVAGTMEVTVALSFSALLFSGLGTAAYARGAGYLLLGNSIANLLVSRWSSLPGSLVVPQDTSTAILATTAAPLLAALDPDVRVASMVLYVSAAAILTGAVMFLIGVIRQGGLVRFIPLPVIGGFLAGTGYLLVLGGAEVITGGFAFTTTSVIALVGGVLLAVAMLLTLRAKPIPGLVPGSVALGIALFFIALAVSGTSMEEARALGLLLSPSGTALGLPMGELLSADWSILATGWGGLVTVPVVATLGMLLNVNALEMVSGRDADLDRELRMVGTANLVVSVAGTPAVYHTVGVTSLGYRVGVMSRMVPVIVAATCLVAVGVGGPVFSILPVPVLGALLVFIGLGFIVDWFVDRRRHMTTAEVVLMAAIVVAVAAFGFLVAVGLGMVVAVILFAVRYAAIDPVRAHARGGELRSTVDRPRAAEAVLAERGAGILIVELHGYLFFGSARSAMDRVVSLMGAGEELEVVVVDLERVTGVDATGVATIMKLADVSLRRAEAFILSGLPASLRREEPILAAMPGVIVRADLDHALETAEELVIGRVTDPFSCSLGEVFGGETWDRLRPYLATREVRAGEVIISEGESSTGVFLVEEGRVVTEIPVDDGYRRVRLSGPGSVVGEMSLYRAGMRSARVSAVEDSVLAEMDGDVIGRIEHDDPVLASDVHRTLATVMAERVAQGNVAIAKLMG